MSQKETGGPAFPVLDYITPEKIAAYKTGMSLRDYFAAKVMQGILSNECLVDRAIQAKMDVRQMAFNTASEAYAIADAMLKEREK